MGTPLDQAIANASAAEATYTGDINNVANINTAIATATAPLGPAQAQLTSDTLAYNAALNALSQAALAAIVPVSGS